MSATQWPGVHPAFGTYMEITFDGPPIPPRVEPEVPPAYFHGTIYERGEGYWILRIRPGEGVGGTCGYDQLACCTTYESAMAAGRLMSGMAALGLVFDK